ncbi:MAG: TIGR03620 family F420-dependent LLM class oxidoreductase [Gammaproteobacteria bacterium]|nr:TIGR03620 family F420-dependent LLM class oxidoreductase [Gammaproteobacteria bacterium]MYG11220.1 TIGR03620 family F420-dependent LLM class oxidoreductase [Gammaproteobacteria bacterium]
MADNDRESRSIEIWEGIRERLRADVDEVVYGPWLEPLTFVESRGGVVRLALPSRFRREWVADTYGAHILALWREEDDDITEVEIVVRSGSRPTPKDDGEKDNREPQEVKSAPAVDSAQEDRRGAAAIKSVRVTNRGAKHLNLQPVREQLGKVGVWSRSPYFYEAEKATSLAVAAEELGYRALWIPGFDGGHIFERCELALKASKRLTIATGVVNIWRHDPAEVAQTVSKLRAASGGRFLLGIGGSHKFLIGDAYDKISPLARMRSYLDELDAAGLPAEDRLLGALGPRMLALCAERTAGTHPCFIPPEFTGAAREVLGDGPLLVPEVTVILESDPSVARALARRFAGLYFKGPNYANMLRRFGFIDDDFHGEGSDRLIDAVVAWGDPETIAARVRAHLEAGADHVAIQSRGPKSEADVWRELAPRVLG